MRRIIQIISAGVHKVGVFLVEKVRTIWYILFFAAVVIVFGFLYTYLTPIGHGIGQNLKPISDIAFPTGILTGIYFSIVTISSLGYGDIHPMGFSKALACIEVLLGLVVIGIMIAKVTSRRPSYHVEHLFSSNAQERLEKFATEFAAFHGNFATIISAFGDAYQRIPGKPPPADKSTLIARFQEIITEFQSRCTELHSYFLDETGQGNYFEIVPATAMVQVGNAVDEAFFSLGQLLTSLPPQAKTEVLDRRSRQGIAKAIDAQIKSCDLVNQYATDQGTRDVFRRIQGICSRLPESYFAEVSQPDQLLQ